MSGQYSAEAKLTDIPPEPLGFALVAPPRSGPRFSPQKLLLIYSPEEWEEFIYEWARTLEYEQIRKFGGANDHGVDIAGFASPARFRGEWDCFQCKHYKEALTPGDAWPEIYKVLEHSHSGYYSLPRAYYFMAPWGVGPSLDQMLSGASNLKEEFLKLLAQGKVGPSKDASKRSAILTYATTVDFSIFRSISPDELIEQHRKSPQHSVRFAQPLPAPPPADPPPAVPAPEEARYLEQLFDVYSEKFGISAATVDELAAHSRAYDHMRRQRQYFYCAEKLRVFYRDKVPRETFENLQEQVEEGVREVHDDDHDCGYDRLQRVLSFSQTLNLSNNPLIDVWQMRDKKGICHQLANEDRLRWCQ